MKKSWIWVDTRNYSVENLKCWWNHNNHVLTWKRQLHFSVKTTSINICLLNLYFQININIEKTLMSVNRFIVDSKLMHLLDRDLFKVIFYLMTSVQMICTITQLSSMINHEGIPMSKQKCIPNFSIHLRCSFLWIHFLSIYSKSVKDMFRDNRSAAYFFLMFSFAPSTVYFEQVIILWYVTMTLLTLIRAALRWRLIYSSNLVPSILNP